MFGAAPPTAGARRKPHAVHADIPIRTGWPHRGHVVMQTFSFGQPPPRAPGSPSPTRRAQREEVRGQVYHPPRGIAMNQEFGSGRPRGMSSAAPRRLHAPLHFLILAGIIAPASERDHPG